MKINDKHSTVMTATTEIQGLEEHRVWGDIADCDRINRTRISTASTELVDAQINAKGNHTGHKIGVGGAARRGFWREDDGSATIEFVIWVPLFMFILTLIADFSMIFMNHAKMWDAAREGARQMAVYNMTAEEAQEYVASKLYNTAPTIEVTASDGDEVVLTVSTPIADASPFGFFAKVVSGTLVARVTMMKEPI